MRWCIKSSHMSSGKGNNVGKADDKGIAVMEIVGNGMGDTHVDTVMHLVRVKKLGENKRECIDLTNFT